MKETKMTELAQRHCEPCEKGTPPLDERRTHRLLSEVPGWSVLGGRLTRDVKVKNFREALALVNRIGDVAEAEGHHPDICIHGWNNVRIDLVTHSIGGLSENDFILAAKIGDLLAA
jgi:4a-hydroxytetrahydrobiopterin dehydratase